jgi:hypothetical protein
MVVDATDTDLPDNDTARNQVVADTLKVVSTALYQYNGKAAEDLRNDEKRMAQIRARKPFQDFIRALTEVPDHVSQRNRPIRRFGP